MTDDKTTFFLAFTIVFAGLGLYLWIIDQRAKRLEARLSALEADTQKSPGPTNPE